MSIAPLGSSPSPAGQDLTRRTGSAAHGVGTRSAVFAALVIISAIIFWTPLRAVVRYSLWGDDLYDKYSYTLAIPFISAALMFVARREIFAKVRYNLSAGIALIVATVILKGWVIQKGTQLGADIALSAQMLALTIFWLGGFILCCGTRALRAGAFPLLFLFLTVPIPDFFLDKPITAVQYGSTEVCSWVFTLSGVPALRDGLRFYLSHNTIEVARECSGIHSTLAIFIVSLLAGHLYLVSPGKKLVLTLLALPIVCLTNGFRIAGLTLLAEYVNPSFLHGDLHKQGGMGFFLLALIILFVFLHFLRGGQDPGAFSSKPSRNEGQTVTSPAKV